MGRENSSRVMPEVQAQRGFLREQAPVPHKGRWEGRENEGSCFIFIIIVLVDLRKYYVKCICWFSPQCLLQPGRLSSHRFPPRLDRTQPGTPTREAGTRICSLACCTIGSFEDMAVFEPGRSEALGTYPKPVSLPPTSQGRHPHPECQALPAWGFEVPRITVGNASRPLTEEPGTP